MIHYIGRSVKWRPSSNQYAEICCSLPRTSFTSKSRVKSMVLFNHLMRGAFNMISYWPTFTKMVFQYFTMYHRWSHFLCDISFGINDVLLIHIRFYWHKSMRLDWAVAISHLDLYLDISYGSKYPSLLNSLLYPPW